MQAKINILHTKSAEHVSNPITQPCCSSRKIRVPFLAPANKAIAFAPMELKSALAPALTDMTKDKAE